MACAIASEIYESITLRNSLREMKRASGCWMLRVGESWSVAKNPNFYSEGPYHLLQFPDHVAIFFSFVDTFCCLLTMSQCL
jgi:hypothetical protein